MLAQSFTFCSLTSMRRIQPDNLRLWLSMWLRLSPRWAAVAFASRDLDKREEAARAMAAKIIDCLEGSRWEVHAPLLRDPHNGLALPEDDQRRTHPSAVRRSRSPIITAAYGARAPGQMRRTERTDRAPPFARIRH